MPKLTICCVGKLKEKYQKEAVNEYLKRLSKYFNCFIDEVADLKIPDNASLIEEKAIIEKEGKLLLKKIPSDAFVIVLDVAGNMYDSLQFSDLLNKAFVQGYNTICVVIGGSLGITSEVINKANVVLSLSKMVFTHLMTREIILEQIYRAMKIIHNEKYHK